MSVVFFLMAFVFGSVLLFRKLSGRGYKVLDACVESVSEQYYESQQTYNKIIYLYPVYKVQVNVGGEPIVISVGEESKYRTMVSISDSFGNERKDCKFPWRKVEKGDFIKVLWRCGRYGHSVILLEKSKTARSEDMALIVISIFLLILGVLTSYDFML